MKIPATLALSLSFLIPLAGCGGHDARTTVEPETLVAPLGLAERVDTQRATELAGTVAALKSTAVSSRVVALVTAVHVDLGDSVRAGQLLVSIDPTVAQGQVSQAQGALAQAEAALTLAARNYERFQALAAKQAASELELDLAKMQFEQARGAVQQARGAVEAASSVAQESKVVAPFAGRVSARMAEVGDLAAPGRPLVMLDSLEGRRLVVAVPESLVQAADLRNGGTLEVTLDAQPALGRIAGRVAEISPGPDPLTHSYTAKIDLPDISVAAGAAGRAYLPAARRSAVLVPREALVESGGLTLVVVRDDEGRAQSRVVTLGESQADGRVEILSGLSGGESVALGLAGAPAAGTRLADAGGRS